jgi:hypothetical protein
MTRIAVVIGLAGALVLSAVACGRAVSPGASTEHPVVAPPIPSPRANSAPAILGDDVCIGAMGMDHIFELELSDAEGDAIRWAAVKTEPRGTLHAAEGERVDSGSRIRIVYSPPAGLRDENWITVTATDDHGASSSRELYARSR